VPNIDRTTQGSLAEFAGVVRDHDKAHVAALEKALGSKRSRSRRSTSAPR
jgi:hypothetical protein